MPIKYKTALPADQRAKLDASPAPEMTATRRILRTVFWTLVVFSYGLSVFGTAALVFDWRFITVPSTIHWSPENDIFSRLSLLCALLLLPLAVYFWRNSLYRWLGLGIWVFYVIQGILFPVF